MRDSIILALVLLPGCDMAAERRLDDIRAQVAADAVERYEIVRESGDPMDRCVQAGFVTAAYLQAGDQSNYERWKMTQRVDCAIADLRR